MAVSKKEEALGAVGFVAMMGFCVAELHLPESKFREPLLATWLITVLCGLIVGLIWIRRGERKTYRIRNKRYCQFCRYDLMGNRSGICPECGKPTDR